MENPVMNLLSIIGAVVVYFGVLVITPKVIKCKYINKKLRK